MYWNCIWGRNFLDEIRRGLHMCAFPFSLIHWLKMLRRGQSGPGKWDDVTVWKTDFRSTHGCSFNHSFTWPMSSSSFFFFPEGKLWLWFCNKIRVVKTFIFFYKNKDVGILSKYFSVSLMAWCCGDFSSAAWTMK